MPGEESADRKHQRQSRRSRSKREHDARPSAFGQSCQHGDHVGRAIVNEAVHGDDMIEVPEAGIKHIADPIVDAAGASPARSLFAKSLNRAVARQVNER